MKLRWASLFEQSAYIGDVWVDDTSLPRVPVINPSTREIIGSVPQVTTQQVDDAVACGQGLAGVEWPGARFGIAGMGAHGGKPS